MGSTNTDFTSLIIFQKEEGGWSMLCCVGVVCSVVGWGLLDICSGVGDDVSTLSRVRDGVVEE